MRLCGVHGHGWTNTGQFLDRLWTQTAIQDNTWTQTVHSPDNCWTVATDVLNSGAAVNANNIAEYDWTIAGQIVDRM